MMNRKGYTDTLGSLSILFACGSVLYGIGSKFGWWPLDKFTGEILIGIWLLIPPIVFWFDWLIYFKEIEKMEGGIEAAKVTYELNRNVWVALIAVLLFLYDIKPFG